MKFLKRKDEQPKNGDSSKNKKPAKAFIKSIFCKILWSILYVFLVFFVLYVLYNALPVIFSLLYSAVGVIIGVDFSSLSTADLTVWAIISISTGAVFGALLTSALKKLFGFMTTNIFIKHVTGRASASKTSDVIAFDEKKGEN